MNLLKGYRRNRMLSDESVDETAFYEKIWNYILEDPLGMYLTYDKCKDTPGKSNEDCLIEVGRKICDEVGDKEICDGIELAARVAVDAIKPKEIEPDSPEAKEREKNKFINNARNVLLEFANIDCSALTTEQRNTLTTRLNEQEALFIQAGLQNEFALIVSGLKCDVNKEFRCNNEDEKIKMFMPAPVCSLKFTDSWGKPLLYGGGVGAATGIVFNKLVKGSVMNSVLAGLVAGGATTYFFHSKAKKAHDDASKPSLTAPLLKEPIINNDTTQAGNSAA
jgi:hypothetical protein